MRHFIISVLMLLSCVPAALASTPTFNFQGNRAEYLSGAPARYKNLKVMFYPRINQQAPLIMIQLGNPANPNDVVDILWFKQGLTTYNYVVSYDGKIPYYTLQLTSSESDSFTFIVGYSPSVDKGFVEFLKPYDENKSVACYYSAAKGKEIFDTIARQAMKLGFRRASGSLYLDR